MQRRINLITRGGNYGWGPHATCATPPLSRANTNQDGPAPVLPVTYSVAEVAPAGAVFSGGSFLYGAFNNRQIHRVTLTPDRTAVAHDWVRLTNSAPILSLQEGPRGQVYFADTGSIQLLG